jgi:hypothetical protein
MTDPSFTPTKERLVLKEIGGWFAAGDSFRNALNVLSDGGFSYSPSSVWKPIGTAACTGAHRKISPPPWENPSGSSAPTWPN